MAGERAVEDPSLSWRWANIRTLTFNVLRHFYFERYRCFPFLACIASVSVMLGSYERPKNRVYGVLHARKMEQEPNKKYGVVVGEVKIWVGQTTLNGEKG